VIVRSEGVLVAGPPSFSGVDGSGSVAGLAVRSTRVDVMDAAPARRKLLFYSTIGPDRDEAAWAPFNLAAHALTASLESEILLAGPATGLMRHEVRERLEGRPAAALARVLDAHVPISVAPGCAKFRGVSSADMAETGARYRTVEEVLVEVAEGAQMVTFSDP
jgi:hypothetical protein